MGTLEAALEETLARLPDTEWDALVLRVRGPRQDYPARRRRTRNPDSDISLITDHKD